MGKYVGRLVSSFIMYSIALVLLLVLGLMVYGWIFDSLGNWYYFNWKTGASDVGDDSDYSSAIFGLLFAAVILTGLCVLLSFTMMCAECCCRITKCMTNIPTTTNALGTLAGLLAGMACVIFIIKLHFREGLNLQLLGLRFYPGYSLYVVVLTCIFLMIAGNIMSGVNYATKVADAPVVAAASSNASQSQGMSMNQSQQMHGGYPGYQAPGPQPFYPQANFYASNNGQATCVRIFVTSAATQTLTEEGKKN